MIRDEWKCRKNEHHLHTNTMPFYIRDLRTHGLWYLRVLGKKSPGYWGKDNCRQDIHQDPGTGKNEKSINVWRCPVGTLPIGNFCPGYWDPRSVEESMCRVAPEHWRWASMTQAPKLKSHLLLTNCNLNFDSHMWHVLAQTRGRNWVTGRCTYFKL